MTAAGQSAIEILKKHGVKPNKSARAKAAVEQAVKDRAKAKRVAGVDPLGAAAQKRAVENDKAAVARTTEHIESLGNTGEKAGSRADLMAQAQNAGIKYFRILNKCELEVALKLAGEKDQIAIDQLINTAKARWQAGWNKKAREAGAAHKE